MIQKLGFRIAIEPHARVIHDVKNDRFTLKHIWNTILSVRRTWYMARRDLYFSREMVNTASLKGFIRSIGHKGLFITIAELNAELHYLAWKVRDWILRFRPSVSR